MKGRLRLIALGAALAALTITVLGAWWTMLRDGAAEPVTMESALRQLEDRGAPLSRAAPSAAAATSANPAAHELGTDETDAGFSLAGDWTLLEGGNSFVGFRIEEEIAGLGAKTAVGRSNAVTATLNASESTIRDVAVKVDMTELRTDNANRDRSLQTRGLETARHRHAGFTLTETILVSPLPPEGQPVRLTATGRLDLHGVVNPVKLPLEAAVKDGVIVVTGAVPIVLADYGIDKPVSAEILTIRDSGTLELALFFVKR
ncbi:MAG: YceI family protein [Acidimicrobiales bacterium]